MSARGQLTYQGKPLEYHQVLFSPEGHRPAAGVTDQEGKFVLGTNAVGDGAVVGRHQVSVVYVGPPFTTGDAADAPPPPPPKVKIPARFNDPRKSGVVVEIPPEGNTDLKVELN